MLGKGRKRIGGFLKGEKVLREGRKRIGGFLKGEKVCWGRGLFKSVTRSYKELQGKSEQQQTYWSLQGCSVLNLMYKYNTIYQSSPMIKIKLYGSK